MKEIQQGTHLHSLWQETSIKKGGRLLGIGEKQSIPPRQLEINKEHLTVCGVISRSRDVAARESGIE
jgi:hypothetical protein